MNYNEYCVNSILGQHLFHFSPYLSCLLCEACYPLSVLVALQSVLTGKTDSPTLPSACHVIGIVCYASTCPVHLTLEYLFKLYCFSFPCIGKS